MKKAKINFHFWKKAGNKIMIYGKMLVTVFVQFFFLRMEMNENV